MHDWGGGGLGTLDHIYIYIYRACVYIRVPHMSLSEHQHQYRKEAYFHPKGETCGPPLTWSLIGRAQRPSSSKRVPVSGEFLLLDVGRAICVYIRTSYTYMCIYIYI